MFLKTMKIRKPVRICLIPNHDFFFNLKNIKNTKLKKIRTFSKNAKIVFSLFSKIVHKNI